MAGGFGIDMLSVSVTDFRLESVQKWKTRGGATVGEETEPWGVCASGEYIHGPGYFVNPGTNFDTRGTWDLKPRGLTVKYNPSTLKHPWHLTTSTDNLRETILEDASRMGLEFDLDGARIGRVDVSRQAVMDAPCRAFIPAFTALRSKRSKDVRYPDGYEFGNKSWKTVFYDKSRQLNAVKGIQDIPPNVLRCELRLMGNKTVGHTGRGLGVGTFGDVHLMEPEQLKATYNRAVETKVFRLGHSEQLTLDFNTEVELLQALREDKPRGAVDLYVAMEGVESILQRFGDLTLFGEALIQAGYSERQARRHLNRFNEILESKPGIDLRRNEKTVATRIQELRNTFTI